MARKYYCLVASLQEFLPDVEVKGFDPEAARAEIAEGLSDEDAGYLRLLQTYHDIDNLVKLRAGREAFSPAGNLSQEEIAAESAAPGKLPEALADIVRAWNDPEDPDYDEMDRTQPLEKALYAAYYELCEASGNRFLRQWGAFDRTLRNLTAAFTARKTGRTVGDAVVGGGDVAETLARSTASDFGLRGEVDFVEKVMGIVVDEPNLVEREKKLDTMRWERTEEIAEDDYFGIDNILGYVVRLGIYRRWTTLDHKTGREMLRRLRNELTVAIES